MPGFSKPRDALQRFVLDVFHAHTRRLGWTRPALLAAGAGAEVWAQRRSGKESQETWGSRLGEWWAGEAWHELAL